MTEQELTISDGGEQTLSCQDCNKPLMHFRVYAPNVPVSHKIYASCPFCNSRSFTKDINGLFWYGPIGSDENLNRTVITDIVMEDKVSQFIIGKR